MPPGWKTIPISWTHSCIGLMRSCRTTATSISWRWPRSFNGFKIHEQWPKWRTSSHGEKSVRLKVYKPVGCHTHVSSHQKMYPAKQSIYRLASDVPTIIHGSTIQPAMDSSKSVFKLCEFVCGVAFCLASKQNEQEHNVCFLFLFACFFFFSFDV